MLIVMQGSNVYLVIGGRTLGQLGSPKSKVVEMAIAPGGFIKQTIVKDPVRSTDWDLNNTIMFNVHLLNASVFGDLLGPKAPTTPVTAELYKPHGYPFFELYEEKSGIEGDFGNIKSIGDLEKEKKGIKRRHDEDIDFPVVELNTVDKKIPFVPVDEMMRKLNIPRIDQIATLGLQVVEIGGEV